MAEREDQGKGDPKRGFAGLSSLVSDVDIAVAQQARESRPAPTKESAPDEGAQPHEPVYQAPEQSSGGSSTGKWLLGIAVVAGLLWLVSQSGNKELPPAPVFTPSSVSSSVASPSPSFQPAPSLPAAPSRPTEERPPIGTNNVLTSAQLRYCVGEDIRVDAARGAISNYNDRHVDRFNAMVADYNSRCGSFRYRSGALESARRDIEPYRSQLQSEGNSKFARPSTDSLSTSAPSRPAPDATVQAIQRKLNDLGYEAGTADGLMGRSTRFAILAFQRDNGLVADGNATAVLLQLLTKSRQVDRQEAQVPAPSLAGVLPTYRPPARDASRQESTSPTGRGIPQNAHLSYLGNDWECNRGYFKYGNECRPVQIPQNGILTYLGNDWECSRGYFKYGTECRAVQIPQNGKLTYLGSDWECSRGYFKYGTECRAVQIPQNGKLSYLGSDWECNRGYFKYGNECHVVQTPPNGKLTYLGNDWECNPGFSRAGSQCVPVR